MLTLVLSVTLAQPVAPQPPSGAGVEKIKTPPRDVKSPKREKLDEPKGQRPRIRPLQRSIEPRQTRSRLRDRSRFFRRGFLRGRFGRRR